MSHDRDLAAAICDELCSEATAAAALDLWQHRRLGPSDLCDMATVLNAVTGHAIDRVLARRQSEAARTGPWDCSTREQQEEIIAQAIEASMFASHELPLSKALHDKYLLTAAHVLDALAAAGYVE